jgi:formylglycine-generating enzyme required for sulfatase activity
MGNNPSHFRGNWNLPVENVSWNDARDFCRKLSAFREENAANRHYQLPTEAQWEYACRAGNEKAWSFSRREGAASSTEDSKSLLDYAWVSENSGDVTHAVGLKKPNQWGLYDMYGNVFQWCLDFCGPYGAEAEVDPTGRWRDSSAALRGTRVQRGGSCHSIDYWCRSATRCCGSPEQANEDVGFRVCAVIDDAAENETPRTEKQRQ